MRKRRSAASITPVRAGKAGGTLFAITRTSNSHTSSGPETMSAHFNRLFDVWNEGRTAVSGWIASPSPSSAEVIASARWDSIIIDMQHGTADYTALLNILPIIQRW